MKALRIFAYEYAYINSPSDHDAQGIQSGWDIKRILGTVPVEKDGSALFRIPANTPVSIQPLDEKGAAIQWMRSWLVGKPGEVVSCVGCHEDQNTVPIPKKRLPRQSSPTNFLNPRGGYVLLHFAWKCSPCWTETVCVVTMDLWRSPTSARGSPWFTSEESLLSWRDTTIQVTSIYIPMCTVRVRKPISMFCLPTNTM